MGAVAWRSRADPVRLLAPLRDPDAVLLALKTAAAAGIAWGLAGLLPDSKEPVLAALAALLVVQVTVRQSVVVGAQRVAGVILGVVLALYAGKLLGLHAWSLALLLCIGLLVGRLLRIGIQVAVSTLIVLSVSGTATGYAEARIVETLIGAAVGVAVNALVVPPTHLAAARAALADLAERAAAVLRSVGDDLRREAGARWDPERTRAVLEAARAVQRDVGAAREKVQRAEESVRWNVRSLPEAGLPQLLPRLRAARDSVGHLTAQTLGIARALDELSRRPQQRWDDATCALLAGLVEAVGDAVGSWAAALRYDDPQQAAAGGLPPVLSPVLSPGLSPVRSPGLSPGLTPGLSPMDAVAAATAAARAALAEADLQPVGPEWRLLGGVLADLAKVVGEVDPVGAHADAFRPAYRGG
jgi:hypothetical protein